MLSLSKPVNEFGKLDQCLSEYGTRFELYEKKQILFSNEIHKDNTFVILSGAISLWRGEHILIGIAQAPFLVGLSDGVVKNDVQYKIITEGRCAGYYLPSSQTIKIIEKNNLWREAFCWLAWKNRIMELRDLQLIGHNSYEQIRATLLSMNEWDEELRFRIGVMNYIHQKTRISRSVVAEVLAALRKGGYIVMSKGKLVGITRLPSEY
ncbi:hydrogen peroxide resistance inhibitor IprA [Citrobacter sp. Awk 4]|uniref:hydrogen peroxide resistance inhibitor IprA n=1 Tax=Citrobacter sp. Awk 4 TaxID=2963955 RepID=UPI0023021990|nr:hydrogen peroxide resistance inhibitor IprA [Citrobacter sp. Awk 4]MDA8478789.1 hydrogen peroxide resistance inhibitor IprA [Citrobacter sp. Awk 4]